MWHTLRCQGIKIGREQTARLMGLARVAGKDKGRLPLTTRKPKMFRKNVLKELGANREAVLACNIRQ